MNAKYAKIHTAPKVEIIVSNANAPYPNTFDFVFGLDNVEGVELERQPYEGLADWMTRLIALGVAFTVIKH